MKVLSYVNPLNYIIIRKRLLSLYSSKSFVTLDGLKTKKKKK
jgi:hypothetical protein